MTRVKLTFNIIFDTDANDLDNMGEELAIFLQETYTFGRPYAKKYGLVTS